MCPEEIFASRRCHPGTCALPHFLLRYRYLTLDFAVDIVFVQAIIPNFLYMSEVII